MTDDIHRTLGRLEAKVDSLLEAQRAHTAHHLSTEARLRDVENDLSKTKTIGSLGAFVVTTLATVFPAFWSK